jgi:hypothetical protein
MLIKHVNINKRMDVVWIHNQGIAMLIIIHSMKTSFSLRARLIINYL